MDKEKKLLFEKIIFLWLLFLSLDRFCAGGDLSTATVSCLVVAGLFLHRARHRLAQWPPMDFDVLAHATGGEITALSFTKGTNYGIIRYD
jgi:hypothetical protein